METPETFDFPFPPYDIQHKFMKTLYETLENEKFGIFESPTGTGKSLSIICGALRWLKDHETHKRESLETNIKQLNQSEIQNETANNEDWISAQSKAIQNKRKVITMKQDFEKMKEYDKKISDIKTKTQETKKKFHHKKIPSGNSEPVVEDIFDDIDLLLKDEKEKEEVVEEEKNTEDVYVPTKIYFCSRTHSQLAQFVGEVIKSPFGNQTRLTTLASRQTYCVNDAVRKLNSLSLINERCLDLQDKKKEKSTSKDSDNQKRKRQKIATGCPYMSQTGTEQFKNEIISEITDVEQLVAIGKDSKVCPYYATRAAVEDSEIVVLPYNTLLHRSTRTASGISLKNNIVIIDEAHNLLDTIGNIHSCEITGHHLAHAYSQVTQYKEKYDTRFSAKNLLRLNQIVFVIGRFIKFLGGKPGNHYSEIISSSSDSTMITLQDLISASQINSLNLLHLIEFCEISQISHKLHSFSEKYQPTVLIKPTKEKPTGVASFLQTLSKTETPKSQPDEESKEEFIMNNPIIMVIKFLECLTNHFEDGRILVSKGNTLGKSSLKYILLNPASHFEDIVKEAKSVIVAGGTMQPISEFRDQLFISAGCSSDRIVEFSCGHVIPPENILPIILCSGPSNKTFDFSYGVRDSKDMIDELGRVLQNIINITPGGVVCFFPSYNYEKLVYDHFQKSGVITKIEKRKTMFREPKLSSEVDSILEKYSSCIKKTGSTGALLFSVVGGKLSEGLNFSDDLGRCVIVVGLPYPNIKSLELQEKMAFLEKNKPGSGKIHYENLCMKAVNQCIGRAVRHKNDYATVLLLDQRYSRSSVSKALPGWIQRSLVTHTKFGPTIGALSKIQTNLNLKCNGCELNGTEVLKLAYRGRKAEE